MANVVNSVQRFSEIMNDIAGASSEQSTGIEQVNTSIVQMDQVTQQNAALVEQASAAAQALAFQASGLLQAVAIFKIHGQETVSPQLRLA
jgi:methyl-accepting chemotaxis protein